MNSTKYDPNLLKEIKKIKIHVNAKSFCEIVKKWPDDKIITTGCEILNSFTDPNDFFSTLPWLITSPVYRFIKYFC